MRPFMVVLYGFRHKISSSGLQNNLTMMSKETSTISLMSIKHNNHNHLFEINLPQHEENDATVMGGFLWIKPSGKLYEVYLYVKPDNILCNRTPRLG